MLIAHDERTHFRCAFDLYASGGRPWAPVLQATHRWLARQAPAGLTVEGLAKGGTWGRSSAVEVRSEAIQNDGGGHVAWALHFDHPCSEHRHRRWSTRVGLVDGPPDTLRVAVAVSHWLLPTFVGVRPRDPDASSPRLVVDLLSDSRWEARLGSERLSSTAEHLAAGQGMAWRARIENPARLSPLVFVSRRRGTPPYLLDAEKLARLLAGSASVVVAADDTVDEELQHVMPKEARCWDGSVRVYFPGAKFGGTDWGRHRFLSPEDILDLGHGGVVQLLVDAITRRNPVALPDSIADIPDVQARRRELRLDELRRSGTESQEYVQLLSEDNASLRKKVEEAAKSADDRQSASDVMANDLQKAREALRDAQEKERSERQARIEAESSARRAEDNQEVFRRLEALPQSVPEVIRLIQSVFPSRLIFTADALKSAEQASINDVPEAMTDVWSCLREMATRLWELHFGKDQPGNIREAFEATSRFGYAPSEGSMTNKNKSLARLRKIKFEGAEFEISPHVKFGNSAPKILRVYYAPHAARRALLIGHCGDHMDTAGTRRRK